MVVKGFEEEGYAVCIQQEEHILLKAQLTKPASR
jgi:hypothetical protein